jgi:hypothetical protein
MFPGWNGRCQIRMNIGPTVPKNDRLSHTHFSRTGSTQSSKLIFELYIELF